MAIEESLIDGLVAFSVLFTSILVYLYLEKRKHLQEQKIRSYMKMVVRLKSYFNLTKPVDEYEKLTPEQREELRDLTVKELEKISVISDKLLFYGSLAIYQDVYNLLQPDITPLEFRTLIIKMKREIEGFLPGIWRKIPVNRIRQRYIQPDDVFFIKGNKAFKFKTK